MASFVIVGSMPADGISPPFGTNEKSLPFCATALPCYKKQHNNVHTIEDVNLYGGADPRRDGKALGYSVIQNSSVKFHSF